MQKKSKKNASIFLLSIGFIAIVTQINKCFNEEELRTSTILALVSAFVIILCGVISLRNALKKQNG